MSFAGHVLDMIRRQKMNRSLQRAARESYKSKLENFRATKQKSTKQYNYEKFPIVNVQEKNRIKQEVKKQFRREALISYLKTGVTLFIIGVLLWILLK